MNGIVLKPIDRFVVPAAIIVLPLLAFAADRVTGEYITQWTGLTLYALYILGLIAYTVISFARSSVVLSISAGVLGTGAAVSALIGTLGILVAIGIFIFSLPWLGPPRPASHRVFQFAVGLAMTAIALSPWLTSWALGKVSLATLRSCMPSLRRGSDVLAAAAGVGLVIAGMAVFAAVDTKWLAHRQAAFETDDTQKWEQALRDINANWLCGHRRCLMRVCSQLTRRFGQGPGECGPFACPFGFAHEAPKVPADLAAPFQTVYGYSVKQVCVIGD